MARSILSCSMASRADSVKGLAASRPTVSGAWPGEKEGGRATQTKGHTAVFSGDLAKWALILGGNSSWLQGSRRRRPVFLGPSSCCATISPPMPRVETATPSQPQIGKPSPRVSATRMQESPKATSSGPEQPGALGHLPLESLQKLLLWPALATIKQMCVGKNCIAGSLCRIRHDHVQQSPPLHKQGYF